MQRGMRAGNRRKREKVMDKFERQLKDDTEAIEAKVSPELRARIDASLHAARASQPVTPAPRPTTSLWWMSSLTGLVTALLIIALFNLNRTDGEPDPSQNPVAMPSQQSPERLFPETFPLEIRPAVLTSPLEVELESLQSDLEKARESVERDLRKAL